jgi:hypothetical protein
MKRKIVEGWALSVVMALSMVGGVSCSSDESTGSGNGSGNGNGNGNGGGGGTATAAGLAMRLRGKSNFLIGIGNTDDSAYALNLPLDIHYEYIVGVAGEGGDWPSWNTDEHGDGAFVSVVAKGADDHGMTPMLTIYSMASRGDGNLEVLTDAAFMTKYWDSAKLVMTRLALFGKPALMQLEPDFWGYAVNQSPDGKGTVKVAGAAADCAGMPDDFSGFTSCWTKLRDQYAPKVALGVHVSDFGGNVQTTLSFFNGIGAKKVDFLTTDMLDRDAGCFEAHIDGNCQRDEGGWYWDETNKTSPNFHDHLAFVKTVTTSLGLPMLWWQVPFGVPSDKPGGTPGHYRDNRVKYIFEHVPEFVAAGGVGAVFGTGAENQTDYKTDGGQFKDAVTKYFASPTAL